MSTTTHPSGTPGPARPSFVVALALHGLRRGMAGPFATEEGASDWAVELIGDDAGWTFAVEPVAPPESLPLASERAAVRSRARRHLSVVR
jgi:hypothetical protein